MCRQGHVTTFWHHVRATSLSESLDIKYSLFHISHRNFIYSHTISLLYIVHNNNYTMTMEDSQILYLFVMSGRSEKDIPIRNKKEILAL